jgi:hypothetical protein
VTLPEFRLLVRREFGPDLHRMTPANVREFLDRVQGEVGASDPFGNRILLNEPERTYEGIIRDFFHQTLEAPTDEAVIRLWLYGLELAIASVTDVEEQRLEKLFAQIGE